MLQRVLRWVAIYESSAHCRHSFSLILLSVDVVAILATIVGLQVLVLLLKHHTRHVVLLLVLLDIHSATIKESALVCFLLLLRFLLLALQVDSPAFLPLALEAVKLIVTNISI